MKVTIKQLCFFSFITCALILQSCKKELPEDLVPSSTMTTFAVAPSQSTTYKGVTITFSNNDAIGTIVRNQTGLNIGSPVDAYDYSTDLVVDQTDPNNVIFRNFNGGRFRDQTSYGICDGDHIFERALPLGKAYDIDSWANSDTWVRPALSPKTLFPNSSITPLWRKGSDTILNNNNWKWDDGNYLEPEVLRVGNTWYCYSQTEIRYPQNIDIPTSVSYAEAPYGPKMTPQGGNPINADRIQLFTSTDAKNWDKAGANIAGSRRGVIIGIPNNQPQDRNNTQIDHEEVIYETINGVGRFVLYFHYFVNDVNKGFMRIPSEYPSTFNWANSEIVTGMSGLGNKIGYVNIPGGRLYVRICSVPSVSGISVPSFQFSSDGLVWGFGSNQIKLVGPAGKSIYFLGMSTIDGTGFLGINNGSNTWNNIIYGGASSTSPTAPDILASDTWLGRVNISTTGTLVP